MIILKINLVIYYNKFENWLLYLMKISSEKAVKENNLNLKLDSPRTLQACQELGIDPKIFNN